MEISFEDILKLEKMFESSGMSEFRLETGDVKLRFRSADYCAAPVAVAGNVTPVAVQTAGAAPAPAAVKAAETGEAAEEKGVVVRAPIAGIFYRSSSPDAEPYVSVGTEVKKDDVIGLIEAMKTMNEVKSPCDGVVTEILTENESMAGFDSPLVRIEERSV
ncbi:MAG: acetyl-CoA carboxylase biotin carboxyl carrier protein [Lachnospiraceae bacterium]|nr:acetyl-CoA carboxylase biotin carboxyl carrier protein [Lachnospiraceae bacterium]